MAPKALHGYYRYTDINFEWHQVIPDPAEKSALKAFLAPDCLTTPDNPLRDPAMDGIELSIGMLKNGESRLLFSSAQIEYIRYWLHAMGLTKALLPLPHSSYLLTQSSFESISPVIYREGSQLRNAQKDIQKNNKKLKGTDVSLITIRKQFEYVRACFAAKTGTWIAIDFEGWELDHTVITEFGYSQLTWIDGEPCVEGGHSVPEKNAQYYNGVYSPNNRNNYEFGETRWIPMQQFKQEIRDLISNAAAKGPLFLVFHDKSGDIKWLKMIDAPISSLSETLPEAMPESGMYALDTALMYNALVGTSNGEKCKLERMCALLGVSETHYYHNAGNDAHCTLAALRSMASGPPIDAQREQRWPGQTETAAGNKVAVKFKDSESEESDDDPGTWPMAQPLSAN
ncbi:hypothetical protein EXIGLDRAFT_635710 [Exidia glandulosa HHB12029]|uniref:Gfd2/YDR514C-like C-terminal domain-containing protein n=1 Tax=Exidia glandulosa HHB12029 TaxID=1314781 RepID=A0A165QY51_EXIGL|nr:hypothetical protein EXIGLDRAFT_635710 [Exidia glandulosa HHB12029]